MDEADRHGRGESREIGEAGGLPRHVHLLPLEGLVDHREEERPGHHHGKAEEEADPMAADEAREEGEVERHQADASP